MKKKIFAVFLAVIVSVSSFAEEDKNNALFIDVGSTLLGLSAGGFGIGLGYERGLTDNFSVLIGASYIGFSAEGRGSNYDTKFTGISAGIDARYYPLHIPVKGWFFDVGGYYSYINITYGEEAVSNMFEIRIISGWKFIFGSGFFLEPGLGYTFAFGDLIYPAGLSDPPEVGGFGLWLGIGFSF